ncbi:MAG TPA: PadR family transcriptional regulator [Methanocella sp.]|nr:PadR family transcriptional regulator [Methanocella sp.]
MSNEVRKGFLKITILRIVKAQPSHGYEIIQEIGKMTHHNWTPSPGSVYPALEFLEKKGYIQGVESDRKKVYTITAKGENALNQMYEKRKQWMQEMEIFFGDILEEKYDDQ